MYRHAKEQRSLHAIPYHGYQVALSIGVFSVLVSIMPIYNKVVFAGAAGDKGFPYPLATTIFQLGVAFVILLIISITQSVVNGTFPLRWPLKHEIKYKVKIIWLAGALFGIKIGVTNWGLKLLPIGPHLLLQSTDIMWTIVFAHFVINERLSADELIACMGTAVGSVLVAVRTHEQFNDVFGLMVNLLSPILLGLVVIEMKKASRILIQPKHPHKGEMGVLEFTLIKLFFSIVPLFPFIYIFEIKTFSAEGSINLNWSGNPVLSSELLQSNQILVLVACGGGIILLFYQVNFTWLLSLVSAITVGIVTGVKIIPQWLGSLIYSKDVDTSLVHISGVLLLLASSVAWTKIKHRNMMSTIEIMTTNSFLVEEEIKREAGEERTTYSTFSHSNRR